jgi:arylsulfatase A-like enzyme
MPARLRTAARAAVVCALALPAGPACGPGGGEPSPPNVLILLLDTTRADRCGFLGYPRPTTPHLDELAKSSVVYEDCWSTASWTGPSHASLFTGLRPEHHGVFNDGSLALRPEAETLAEILSANGWQTASWSNNPYVSAEFGLTQGFRKDEALHRIPNRTYPWARDTHALALKWMLEQRDAKKPFLAFVNDLEPHFPYHPPRDVEARFVRPDVPAAAVRSIRDLVFPRSLGLCLGEEAWAPGEREALSDLYDAEIATLDAEVGTLVDGMRAAGLLDRTLLVVLSDHGEGVGDHGFIEHGIFMYRNLLRVPLVLRLPGQFGGGRRVKDVVRIEDVFPTVLETCGVPVPGGVDGRSLRGDTSGRTAIAYDGAYTSWAEKAARAYPKADLAFLRTGRRSAFDGRWHLIVDDRERTELYDVAADPGELRDVAAAHPDVVARLRAVLRDAHGR